MTPATAKRKRRRARALLKHGKAAVRRHKRLSGRTGGVHAKQTKGGAHHYAVYQTNPPPPDGKLGGPLF